MQVCNSGKTFLFNYNCVSALGKNLKKKNTKIKQKTKTCQNTSIKKVKWDIEGLQQGFFRTFTILLICLIEIKN